jgi:hypothetical protein
MTFPFSTSPTRLSEDQVTTISQQLANGVLPWTSDAPINDVDVYAIVRGCWNLIPQLRPPAGYTAQRLLDLVARCSVSSDKASSIVEVPAEVKDLVFQKIEARRKKGPVDAVYSYHASMLHDAVIAQNDPLSSALLGAAIWWELAPMDIYNIERLTCVGSALPEEGP